jgi:hypothetical protein
MSSMYPSFGGAAARPCVRCGAPLAPNESQCSRCGTYNPLPQGQQLGMFQQGAQGSGQGASGPSWGASSPQAPQFPQGGGGAWPGGTGTGAPGPSASAWGPAGQQGGWSQNSLFNQQSSSTSQYQQNLFGAPNGTGFPGQNQSSFNNGFSGFQRNPNQSSLNSAFFKATQQNGWTSPLSPNRPDRPAWMQGSDDDESGGKKRTNPVAVVVILVLVVALIGGGGFFGYKLLKSQNSANTTQNNPPTIVTPTGTPLFGDRFQDNKAGWDLTQPAGAKITLANGALVLESDNNKLFPELLPGGKTFSDFRLDVDAGLTSGNINNGYGVYIRGASTQNSNLGLYYRFEVYGDGSFVIYKGTQDANGNSQSTSMKQSPPNNAIAHEGQLNHLTIIAKGQQMTFIVNTTTVATFTDNSYKSGIVALFVSNVLNVAPGAQATFKNLAIFPAS